MKKSFTDSSDNKIHQDQIGSIQTNINLQSFYHHSDEDDELINTKKFVSSGAVEEWSANDADDLLSVISGSSNWTHGRSKQRLQIPNSLKGNNAISKAVVDRKIQHRVEWIKQTDEEEDKMYENITHYSNEDSSQFPPKRPLSPYIFFSQEVNEHVFNPAVAT